MDSWSARGVLWCSRLYKQARSSLVLRQLCLADVAAVRTGAWLLWDSGLSRFCSSRRDVQTWGPDSVRRCATYTWGDRCCTSRRDEHVEEHQEVDCLQRYKRPAAFNAM